jgi:hypothetical protein
MKVGVPSALTATIGRSARWLARRAIVLGLAGLLPESWREHLASRVRRLRRIANVYDFPVRLEFADAAKQGPPRFHIIVYGAFFEIWNPALANPKLWETIPGVAKVLRITDRSSLDLSAPSCADIRTVIIPLGEQHYREVPTHYLSLVPDARSIATLANKGSFAAYTEELGLSKLCPENYKSREHVEFPFVLKRVDLAGGIGVELVSSHAHLDRLLKTAIFRGQEVLLQAFVPGANEYVTHCVCRDGVILWSRSFAWDLGSVAQFGIPVFGDTIWVTASCRTLSAIARVLAPLRYSGPCCVNYKLLPNGEIAIFEINPRLGGSLMNPRNIEFLRQAMTHIICNAA